MKGFNGLSTINVELTNICNKNCWMCGRRKIEKHYPELAAKYGHMDLSMVVDIARQLPSGIVVQLHNNGEPTMYPDLGRAIRLFENQIKNFVTNGYLLVKKSDQIIGQLDTMAISIYEKDPDADEQYEIIMEFLSIKGCRKPYTILRLNGNVKEERYKKFGLPFARRLIHAAEGSFNYGKDPTIPETGICLDFLNHLAINRTGEVSFCVRFDPKRLGVLGNLAEYSLEEIWNSSKRRRWLELHKKGERAKVPLCSYCHFWGVPTGPEVNTINRIDPNVH